MTFSTLRTFEKPDKIEICLGSNMMRTGKKKKLVNILQLIKDKKRSLLPIKREFKKLLTKK
jgi:hypothetical protein